MEGSLSCERNWFSPTQKGKSRLTIAEADDCSREPHSSRVRRLAKASPPCSCASGFQESAKGSPLPLQEGLLLRALDGGVGVGGDWDTVTSLVRCLWKSYHKSGDCGNQVGGRLAGLLLLCVLGSLAWGPENWPHMCMLTNTTYWQPYNPNTHFHLSSLNKYI